MPKPKKRINCQCDYCKNSLSLIPSKIQKNEHHFCNRQCYANWKKLQPKSGRIVKCANCGKPIYQQPHRFKVFDNFYCQPKCQKEWRKANGIYLGSNNPAWHGGYDKYYGPNWSQQQKQARKRDNYICQICSATRLHNKNKALTVHHIKSFQSFDYISDANDNYLIANDLSNLITLCRRCHRGIENGITINDAKKLYTNPPEPAIEINGEHECLICHKTFLRVRDLYFHSKRVHNVRKDEYILTFIGQPLCTCGCGKPVKYNETRKRFPKYLNGHNMQNKQHTLITKTIMSVKRQLWWKHQ